jgi:hypothetical protein
MNCEQVSEHLLQRIQGQLAEPTLVELQEHLGICRTCRYEAEEIQAMWALLGQLGEERSNEKVRARFYAMLDSYQQEAERRKQRVGLLEWIESWWPRRPAIQAGLALATLVLGVLFGWQLGGGSRGGAELQSLRNEVQTMTQAVTLSLLQHQSASERLRAVSLSQASRQDAEIARALLHAVNHDSNVNVRLAAVDVLAEMVQRTDVRQGLIEALPRQTSPTMQVALADVLAAVNGPRSEAVIREVLEREELLDVVREHLEEVLSQGGQQI